MNKRFGRNDLIFFLVVIGLIFIISVGIRMIPKKNGVYLVVTIDNQIYGSYSLEKDQQIDIKDSDGVITNSIGISNGKVSMIEANWPDQICMHHKEIEYGNETIICLPNKVILSIESTENSKIDVIAQ